MLFINFINLCFMTNQATYIHIFRELVFKFYINKIFYNKNRDKKTHG